MEIFVKQERRERRKNGEREREREEKKRERVLKRSTNHDCVSMYHHPGFASSSSNIFTPRFRYSKNLIDISRKREREEERGREEERKRKKES